MKVAYISSKQRVLGLFSGLTLLTFGVIMELKFQVYLGFLPIPFNPAPTLMILLGAVVFLVGFFGCCAADKRNYYIATAFAWLLVFVLVAEIGVVVIAYIFHRTVKSFIVHEMRSTMNNYSHSEKIRTAWDNVQQQFYCCGTLGPVDWQGVPLTNRTIPQSCCNAFSNNNDEESSDDINQSVLSTEDCEFTVGDLNTTSIYTTGCVQSVLDWIDGNELIILCAGGCIALVQIIGIVLTFSLAFNIRRESGILQKEDWSQHA